MATRVTGAKPSRGRSFYDEVLAPVVDHPEVEGDMIDSIIESGLTYLAERDEESAAAARRREVLARARAKQGPAP